MKDEIIEAESSCDPYSLRDPGMRRVSILPEKTCLIHDSNLQVYHASGAFHKTF